MTLADSSKLDQLCINTIRTLAMDAVEAADSGHPGTPMALAPVAYCVRMNTFGAPAPLNDLQHRFGFEPANVVRAVKQQIALVAHAPTGLDTPKSQIDGR